MNIEKYKTKNIILVETASMVNKSNHSRAKEKRMIGIIWGPDRKYTSGVQPSICLHSSGIVVEVHKSEYRDTVSRFAFFIFF